METKDKINLLIVCMLLLAYIYAIFCGIDASVYVYRHKHRKLDTISSA
jgi:hypothetical protein